MLRLYSQGAKVKNSATALDEQPFMSALNNNVIPFWSSDLTDGRAHAEAVAGYMARREAPSLLGQITKQQMAIGVYGVIEIAFWQRIAELVMSAV